MSGSHKDRRPRDEPGERPPMSLAGLRPAVERLIARLTAPAAAERTAVEPSEVEEMTGSLQAINDQPSGAPTDTSPEPGWRSLIDAMSDAAIVLDAAGNILHFNPLVADLFPRARAGQPIDHLTRSPELLDAVADVFAKGDRIVVHLQDRVPVMRRISAIITAIPHDDGSGAPPALLIVLRDLTDQEKHAQMRSDFIAYASHELRTPLASLRGFIETLMGPAREDVRARERFLSLMAAQASRMTRLIDDLLQLSRAEMRVHVAPRGTVDLNEVAGFVAQSLEPVAEASSATITVLFHAVPAWVPGERDELVQVFQNLVHNAIKYGREGGRVEIRLSSEPASASRPQRIVVAVRDDGPGIADEHLPRLTERFYRVSPARSREKGGTGLGLAIVKYIVNRHRGELRIESEVGKGSTFTVAIDALPRARWPRGQGA